MTQRSRCWNTVYDLKKDETFEDSVLKLWKMISPCRGLTALFEHGKVQAYMYFENALTLKLDDQYAHIPCTVAAIPQHFINDGFIIGTLPRQGNKAMHTHRISLHKYFGVPEGVRVYHSLSFQSWQNVNQITVEIGGNSWAEMFGNTMDCDVPVTSSTYIDATLIVKSYEPTLFYYMSCSNMEDLKEEQGEIPVPLINNSLIYTRSSGIVCAKHSPTGPVDWLVASPSDPVHYLQAMYKFVDLRRRINKDGKEYVLMDAVGNVKPVSDFPIQPTKILPFPKDMVSKVLADAEARGVPMYYDQPFHFTQTDDRLVYISVRDECDPHAVELDERTRPFIFQHLPSLGSRGISAIGLRPMIEHTWQVLVTAPVCVSTVLPKPPLKQEKRNAHASLIIGQRGTGKTLFSNSLRTELENEYGSFDKVLSLDLRNNIDDIRSFLKHVREHKSIDKHYLLVIDDFEILKNFQKSQEFEEIMFNGKRYGLSVIVLMQYALSLRPSVREQFDNVFVFKDTNISNLRSAYNMYGSGHFATFESFSTSILNLSNYSCLKIPRSLTLLPTVVKAKLG